MLPLLALSLTARAENDLIDLLNNRNHDREAILRQFENIEETSPLDSSGKRIFLSPTLNAINPDPKPPQVIALVLPTLAAGRIGQAAQNFHGGCLSGAKSAGGMARIDIYPTDGAPKEALFAYQSAVDNGADIIIGPLRRGNAHALSKQYPTPPMTTLLLQPGDWGEGYYVLSLAAESEAAELAELIYESGAQKTLIVVQYGKLGQSQEAAFKKRWLALSHRPPAVFRVRNPKTDWKRLFEQLKKLAKDDDTTTVFAAGDAKFVRQARSYVPSRHPVFAGSFASDINKGIESIFLENLMFMEMPWLLTDTEADIPFNQTALLRRFFALGADACEITLKSEFWNEGWGFSGLSGELHLAGDEFRRRGVLAQYRGGRLRPLP